MAASTATISSASGETAFVTCPSGTGMIALTGDITAGAVCLVGCAPEGTDQEFVFDRIDQTAIRETANEAANNYSYGAAFQVGVGWRVALVADANFAGSVVAIVTADSY